MRENFWYWWHWVLNHSMRWNRLRWLGSSRVIQTSYFWLFLVPALAKVLEALESPVVLDALGTGWTLTLELPFSWKLFYFSTVAFTVATATYHLRCPKLIQDHWHFADFQQHGKGRQELDGYNYQLGERFRSPALEPGSPHDDLGVEVLFWEVWRHAERVRVIARTIATLAYAVGFMLAATVVVQNLVFVVRFV